MTTARERMANELDRDLFNLISRVEGMYETASRAEKTTWFEILFHLRDARPKVRQMMSREDRERT